MEAIKVTVAQHVKRERRKNLPERVGFWDFDCWGGLDHGNATVTYLTGVPKAIEAAAIAGGTGVYMEVLLCPGHRAKPLPCEREEP